MPDPNRLMEAVINDPELGTEVWEAMCAKATENPLFSKILKEGLYSDVSGALGAVHDVVWKAAWAKAIGREIIKVLPTTNALERFPKEISAVAYDAGEAPAPGTAGRVNFQDINVPYEPSSKKEWTQSYIEDASWNVLSYQIEQIGKALAKFETQKIVALYNAIAAGSLAGGAEKTITDGAPTWAEIVAIVSAVAEADWEPKVVAMNAPEFGYLFNHDQFINALYLPHGKADIRNGVIYHTGLNVTFVRSTLITKTLVVDLDAAAVMLLRREVNSRPYEDPARGPMYGVSGNERFGLGVLRADAVARGTN